MDVPPTFTLGESFNSCQLVDGLCLSWNFGDAGDQHALELTGGFVAACMLHADTYAIVETLIDNQRLGQR